MHVTFLGKDPNSFEGDSPTLFATDRTDRRTYIAQGWSSLTRRRLLRLVRFLTARRLSKFRRMCWSSTGGTKEGTTEPGHWRRVQPAVPYFRAHRVSPGGTGPV